jgi:hypothetical protein
MSSARIYRDEPIGLILGQGAATNLLERARLIKLFPVIVMAEQGVEIACLVNLFD